MIIQIDGTSTLNKGAELMLYAIIDQIEEKYPKAKVIFNTLYYNNQIRTSLNFKQPFSLKYANYFNYYLSKLNISHKMFTEFYPKGRIDVMLDASGFRHGDQWNLPESYFIDLENYYRKLKKKKTKIILLPQAFGPFKSSVSVKGVDILNKYADLIIARDHISYQNLLEGGGNKDKILQFPDFTILTKKEFPEKYSNIVDGICINPNKKMITHANLKQEDYIHFVKNVIEVSKKYDKNVFLLNHEGPGDLDICNKISEALGSGIQIVSGLNAKEIKGIIGKSYLVISSRYHGVANALNQAVPCLATSWNHKYGLLFNDFNLNNNIIDISKGGNNSVGKVEEYLNPSYNLNIREKLKVKSEDIKSETNKMWQIIWNYIDSDNSNG
jgi:polysaccharide pyruvyl transferase WcaK-like protein